MSKRYVFDQYSTITGPIYSDRVVNLGRIAHNGYYVGDDELTISGDNLFFAGTSHELKTAGSYYNDTVQKYIGALKNTVITPTEFANVFYMGDDEAYLEYFGGENGLYVHGRGVKSGKVRDAVVGRVAGSSKTDYSETEVSEGYLYTYLGYDSIDPYYITYSSDPVGGSAITISVRAATNTYGGTITYAYEINTGSGWENLSTTTGTSVSYVLQKGTTTFAARVKASDSYGFTSADYITGGTVTVRNNAAPVLTGMITLPTDIKGGSTITIQWPTATDEDGNLSGYKLEQSVNGGSWIQIYQGTATETTDIITYGWATVQYRVAAYDTDGDTSNYVASEQRTVRNASAPTTPTSITVPVSPHSGQAIAITWTASTDDDGDLSGYALERSLDGGDWVELWRGDGLSYSDTLAKGTGTVAYRVRAFDADAAYSDYTTSATRTVTNNDPPVITLQSSAAVGTVDTGFSISYTVTDSEDDAVTVTESVGGVVKRTYTPTLGKTQTFKVMDGSGDYFFTRILNGDRVARITATDSSGTATADITFTKAVHHCYVSLATPLTAEETITVAIMAVAGSIPADATYTLEATNNAADDSPVWQDVAADVAAKRNIVFENTTQANGPAFNFRLRVERGDDGVGGYIESLQGGFQ